jgi:hypothetical protein
LSSTAGKVRELVEKLGGLFLDFGVNGDL